MGKRFRKMFRNDGSSLPPRWKPWHGALGLSLAVGLILTVGETL